MGAYMLLHPGREFLPWSLSSFAVPAVIFLGLWYVMQFVSGINALGGGLREGWPGGRTLEVPVRDALDHVGPAPLERRACCVIQVLL